MVIEAAIVAAGVIIASSMLCDAITHLANVISMRGTSQGGQ